MNSRARNRLIGVTVLILVLAAAAFLGSGAMNGAYSRSVKEIAGDASLAGTRVRVRGAVVPDSWNKRTNPMLFSIRDEGATSGPVLKVSYMGSAPNTFGNGIVAIVTGTLGAGGTLKADDLLTVCPSTYASKSGAGSVADLLAAPPGSPMRISGFLKAGSLGDAGAADRFVLTNTKSGGPEVPVAFQGAMPAGTKDGVELVLFGKLMNGKFVATQVALPQ